MRSTQACRVHGKGERGNKHGGNKKSLLFFYRVFLVETTGKRSHSVLLLFGKLHRRRGGGKRESQGHKAREEKSLRGGDTKIALHPLLPGTRRERRVEKRGIHPAAAKRR